MKKIKEFILELEQTRTNSTMMPTRSITPGMVSRYKWGDVTPRFDVAKRIYKKFGVVIYPFDVNALKEQ